MRRSKASKSKAAPSWTKAKLYLGVLVGLSSVALLSQNWGWGAMTLSLSPTTASLPKPGSGASDATPPKEVQAAGAPGAQAETPPGASRTPLGGGPPHGTPEDATPSSPGISVGGQPQGEGEGGKGGGGGGGEAGGDGGAGAGVAHPSPKVEELSVAARFPRIQSLDREHPPSKEKGKGSKKQASPKEENDQSKEEAAHASGASSRTEKATRVHVCLSGDDPDLRPVAVAINSTLRNAKDPDRLSFHLVTSVAAAANFEQRLRSFFPAKTVRFAVHSDETLEKRIEGLVTYRESSHARKALSSPFNFVPFYLHQYLSKDPEGAEARRLLYLDTDTLVLGDIAGLADVELGQNPAGAVEDCSQAFETYFDFKGLKKIFVERRAPLYAGAGDAKEPYARITPKTCVFNRGVFVMDVPRWRAARVTEEIEWWMAEYANSPKRADLYHYGMSQPPWLLSLGALGYQKLSGKWNVRGLGRTSLLASEREALKKKGFDAMILEELGVKPFSLPRSRKCARRRCARPLFFPDAATAKVLHYNGPKKPWSHRWGPTMDPKKGPVSICGLPTGQRPEWADLPKVLGPTSVVHTRDGSTHNFVECSALWWAYLSGEANEALKNPR